MWYSIRKYRYKNSWRFIMNFKTVMITILLTAAPLLQANPFGWAYEQVRKHPYVTTAFLAVTGFGIYHVTLDTPADDDFEEHNVAANSEVNQSPRMENPSIENKTLLALARKKYQNNEATKTTNARGDIVFEFSQNSKVITTFNRFAKPIKSCLKPAK